MNAKLRQMKRKFEDREDQDDSTKNSSLLEKAKEGKLDSNYVNKQRCLVFCSRGIIPRYRHLLEDFRKLIPHHKKDVKFDGEDLREINEIAEIKSCNSCIFFETRKKRDLYMWVGNTPTGPSAKFHVHNVHTMEELKMTGNSLVGSRPLLTFTAEFGTIPHLKLLKTMFTTAFGTPRNHPKSKPFIDRIMGFYYLDDRIWIRNYQITDNPEELKESKHDAKELVKLVEIGPRLVLNCIRIFDGSFGGQSLFQNANYISPNLVRRQRDESKHSVYVNKKRKLRKKQVRDVTNATKPDELADVFMGDDEE